jgi:hypothetical protein
MTAFPGVQAQGVKRPGEFGGPSEMVIVAWEPGAIREKARPTQPLISTIPIAGVPVQVGQRP